MEPAIQTEDELETFRRQWKEEVQAKNRRSQTVDRKRPTVDQSTSTSQVPQRANVPLSSRQTRLPSARADGDSVEGYHYEIEDKELGRKIGDGSERPAGATTHDEPKTALEYYEKAAEKEGQGRLGDSLADYRKAFKLDAKVHEKYRSKYFPPTKPGQHINATVDTESLDDPTEKTSSPSEPLPTGELIASFAACSIGGEAPPTEFSPLPPCPIANIPEEVLVDILFAIARNSLPSLVQLSQASKRLAYLVSSEDSIWRQMIQDPDFGIPAMLYDFTCSIDWKSIIDVNGDIQNILEANSLASLTKTTRNLPLSATFPTYRHMFRTRPRIRFNGCYISTVNYTRPGGVGSNSLTWNHNVLIVTYYRYLRFFRDGSVISLLTTSEPTEVVPYLQKEYVRHQSHGGGHLPQNVMKDALKGRWHLSGDPYGTKAARARQQQHSAASLTTDATAQQQHQQQIVEQSEVEGDVHIETEGVVAKYKYIMHLRFASAGTSKGTGSSSNSRSSNNKLNWVGYWCHNKMTDDVGEFGMKNYRPYFWSRVRSWH